MDLHERYMYLPIKDLSILELLENTFQDDPFSLLHRFVRYYDAEIAKDQIDRKKLEMFRMILCYEYQLVINSAKGHARTASKDMCFQNIENTLIPGKQTRVCAEAKILHDIIILKTVLYCSPRCIEQHIMNFQKSSETCFPSNNELRHYYMKMMECFLDCLGLRQFLYNDIVEISQHLSSIYLKDLILWLELKEEKEWRLFASIFPKLVDTFTPEKIIPTIWDFVINKLEYSSDVFAALSTMVDTCFPLNIKNVTDTYRALCYTEMFWKIIMEALILPVQQYRKQAVFIMKRVVNFMSKMNTDDLQLKPAIVPFLCKCSKKIQQSMNIIKDKFFLILEALEEKQYHLVAPALTHLSSLVKAYQQHASCNCLDIAWVRLIFERTLQHENNNVVKQGISDVCKIGVLIVDRHFMEFFINILDNTFLYECQFYRDEPEILNEVAAFFMRAEQERPGFISEILMNMSNITWGPIPIFYVLKMLRGVLDKIVQTKIWKRDEISNIKNLIQQNLNMHSHILRIASQVELLRILPHFCKKVEDLGTITTILSEFPSKEAFTRGGPSWITVTAWLGESITKADALNFVHLTCDKYLLPDAHSEINSEKFAFMICILYDANLVLYDKTCPVEKTLNHWLSSLNGVDMRPYADIMSNINTTEFMSHLLNLSITGANEGILRLLSPYFNVALRFLLKCMKNVTFKLNYDDMNRYLHVLDSFLNNGELLLSKKELLNYVEKFRNESICIFESVDHCQSAHYACVLHVLHLCQNISSTVPASFYTKPLIDIRNIQLSEINSQIGQQSEGKVASDCYLLLAKLTYQYVTKVPMEAWPTNISWLQNTLHLYETGGKEIIPVIGSILKVLVNKNAIRDGSERTTLESIFAMCWKTTFLNKKNRLFWLSVKNLTGVIINDNFLTLPDAMSFVEQFLDQLLEEGDNLPRLKKILLTEMETLHINNLRNFVEPLLSCLVHGHVLRKDKKIENQAYLYISENYKDSYPQHVSLIDYNNDATVRALSIILLHKIINDDLEYAPVLLSTVLEKLEKYKNKRYFNHSYIHKVKHRLMQVLLVLQPSLNETANSVLQERICDLMLLESNQHSVRIMQEWLLIRIFGNNISFHPKLWKFFEEGIKVRPGCTSSIACIVYHVAQLLPHIHQGTFISTAIKYIARCCLGQQFNMRLYNQVIFVKLYKLLETLNYTHIIDEYRGLYNAALESLQEGNLSKNSDRIQDDFYLSVFHPLSDYSLQTLYYELPRLTDIDADELITPNLFEMLHFKNTNDHPLQLYNMSTSLSEIKTSPYIAKSSTGEIGVSKCNSQDTDGLRDIQKKIDPSASINPCKDNFETLRQSIAHKKALLDEQGIIVVASLVDRIPNLGGLARTCEIFNVKEFVIANVNCMKDKDFQSLSVSAEKWITVTEVKSYELQKYLLEKKETGWHLVGVEQTNNSINLLNMKFDKKTILVLGNEKDGIPANLIPLFDTCVEVPQAGVIRSLNVHVTGAICIWQYAKQHILPAD